MLMNQLISFRVPKNSQVRLADVKYDHRLPEAMPLAVVVRVGNATKSSEMQLKCKQWLVVLGGQVW